MAQPEKVTKMTYQQATNKLPEGSKWSSSFGYPGEGGYCDFWRDRDGKRYQVSNGKYGDFGKFVWAVEEISQ